ncbi:MAG: DUF6864 domain-containing function [Candidatus Nomurabacteria bacterium]
MVSIIKKITNGEYELVDSGTVQILENEPLTMFLESFSLVFSFGKSENNNKEPSIKFDNSELNVKKFILLDMNMVTYGTTDFFKFVNLEDGGSLYISFRINSLDNKNVRSLEYSIYKK